MRIGIVTGEYPPMQGGIADFTRTLTLALRDQGHALFIFTDRRGAASDVGIDVAAVVNGWGVRSLLRVLGWARAKRLDAILLEYEAVAFSMTAPIHWLPRLLRPTPTVTTFHDLLVPYLFPKAGRLRYQALLTLANGSRGVIVTNREDEQRLRADLPNLRLTRIPIGSAIPTDALSVQDRIALRERLGVAADTLLIGYFGFFNASKGIDTLLDGFALAIAHGQTTQGLDARLLIIGGQTGASDPTNAIYRAQIDQHINVLSLGSRVIETGFASDAEVGAYLQACDVVALPFTDGVSFRRSSFMAALALGCAIISTTPAIPLPELERAVYLIPPKSAAALATALRELADQPTRRAELSAQARTLAQDYGWESIASRTVSFLQNNGA